MIELTINRKATYGYLQQRLTYHFIKMFYVPPTLRKTVI